MVLAILGLFTGLVYQLGPGEPTPVVAIDAAARELRSCLQEARNLALRTQKVHAVTFNLAVPGDGQVLRNFTDSDPETFPGRHWYAIIGPLPYAETRPGAQLDQPPSVTSTVPANELNNPREALAELCSVVRRCQIGVRHFLPRGVRFLALSDYDGGADTATDDRYHPQLGSWRREGHPGTPYPVPWFGLLKHEPEANAWRLVPWGFDDHAFARQGWGRPADVPPGLGTASAFGPGTYPDYVRNGARQLVEGECLDAALYFQPDGSVRWAHDYANKQGCDEGWYPGIHPWSSSHATAITGGFHITLARDIDDTEPIYASTSTWHYFQTPHQALQSIVPFRRVFVHAVNGLVRVRRGLDTVPEELIWVDYRGMPRNGYQMDGAWAMLDPYCRVQQQQDPADGRWMRFDEPAAYHLDDDAFIHFRWWRSR